MARWRIREQHFPRKVSIIKHEHRAFGTESGKCFTRRFHRQEQPYMDLAMSFIRFSMKRFRINTLGRASLLAVFEDYLQPMKKPRSYLP